MIGTRLGHYEITGHLGSGGMGEVYHALDSKLGRSVAIKILPEAFARDADRIARFEREARVLASLNHPHIASLHGLEESGGRSFLVMELVAGETLAERIARGMVPISEALTLAQQIAEALEAAHERGVVHRDLKPANIKVTPDGQVKVLDFGLAKAFSSDAAEPTLSNSPTMSRAMTNAGMILGTAAYMSPEQAKGRAVDKRGDIFAFGSILYEMLSGEPVFPGESVTEILARVIEREPDFTKLPPNLHPRIIELLRRCLEKDPKKRRRDMGDVRIEIEQVLAQPSDTGAQRAIPTQIRFPLLPWAVAAVLGIAFFAALAAYYWRAPAENAEMRLDIATPPTSDPLTFALSPDGRRIVFVASAVSGEIQRLWLRPLDNVTAQPLPGTEGAQFPFWSADSRSIGFFADSKLKRIDIGGGLPQPLADAPGGRGGAWNSDGQILFAARNGSPLMRIPAAGGTAEPATKLEQARHSSHRFPQFLPGGRDFLFFAAGGEADQGIHIGSLDTSEIRLILRTQAAGFYIQSGWLLFLQQGTLMARRFDSSRGELTGDPLAVADPVGFDGALYQPAFSVAASGLIAYRTSGASRRQLTWFDRSGKAVGTLGAADADTLLNPELSADGRRAVVDRTAQGNSDVWIIDAARRTRLTFDADIDHGPIWSPDGTRIAFDSARKKSHDLYWKSAGGAGTDEVLFESADSKGLTGWSADGKFILFGNEAAATGRDIWVLPLEGDKKPRPLINTTFAEHNAQFSPDGRWVLYQSNETGRFEIHVRPFPESAGQWQVSTDGGIAPRWRRDGKEIFYLGPDNRLMAASVFAKGQTLEIGTPVPLFPTRVVGGFSYALIKPQYDVAPDGRFLINVNVEDASISPITLLLNWKPPEQASSR